MTLTRIILRRAVPAALIVGASISTAAGQQPGAPRSPVCVRLEAQLAALTRGHVDPQRAEQIRRYEEAASRQQQELDRLSAQARRSGCEGRGFFSLFGGQPPECAQMSHRIQQMRANLDKVLSDLQRLQGGTADHESERQAILSALGQNDCGPQYREFANRGGGSFFERLFGGGPSTIVTPPGAAPGGSGDTFRTVCVRTCDGFYFPISYSTTPANFQQDAQACQRMCPAAEVKLYTHRNPGEDMAQAVSIDGRPYVELPTAFAYRKQVNPACGCRAAGQSWADALRNVEDPSIERGDIIVTEEQAKILSAPLDAKGRPQLPAKSKSSPTNAEPPPAQEGGKRTVRTVGPPFLPKN